MFNRLLIISFFIVSMTFGTQVAAEQTNAHKLKTAFSIVLFNQRTNNLEVMHRFYLHDAEEAVWELIDKKADIIGDQDTQAQFTQYVINRFAMKDQTGKDIPLELVGFQNDAGFFWVYQEIKQPQNLTELHIKHDALRDIWDEQFNVVNIEGLEQIVTLSFSGSDTWLTAKLTE